MHIAPPPPLQIYPAPCVAMHGHMLPTSTPIFKPTSLSLFPCWSSLSDRLVLGEFLHTGVLKDRSCEGGLFAKVGTTISVAVQTSFQKSPTSPHPASIAPAKAPGSASPAMSLGKFPTSPPAASPTQSPSKSLSSLALVTRVLASATMAATSFGCRRTAVMTPLSILTSVAESPSDDDT